MTRTSVSLPRALKSSLARQASEMGMSFGEFVRQVLKQSVLPKASRNNRTMFDLDVFKGPGPSDVSQNVDDYLYGAKRDLH